MQQIPAELSEKSELIRSRWAQHQVFTWLHQAKTLDVPGTGPLEIVDVFMSVEGTGGQTVALVVLRAPIAFEAAFALLWRSAMGTEGDLGG